MRNTIIEGDPWYFRQSLELFYSQVKPQWRLHEILYFQLQFTENFRKWLMEFTYVLRSLHNILMSKDWTECSPAVCVSAVSTVVRWLCVCTCLRRLMEAFEAHCKRLRSILRWGNHPGCFAEWCNKNARVWGFLSHAHSCNVSWHQLTKRKKKQLSNDKWNHIYINLYSFLPSAHLTKSIPSPWNRPLTWGHWESKINRQNSLQLLEWNCEVLTSCMVAAEQSHFSHKKQYFLIATNIQYCIKIFSHSSLLWVLFVEPLNADLWIIQA